MVVWLSGPSARAVSPTPRSQLPRLLFWSRVCPGRPPVLPPPPPWQRQLGAGGHGAVFVAHTRAGSPVAVKVSAADHGHNARELAAVSARSYHHQGTFCQNPAPVLPWSPQPPRARPCPVHSPGPIPPFLTCLCTNLCPCHQMGKLFGAPHANVVRWLRPAMRDDKENRICQVRPLAVSTHTHGHPGVFHCLTPCHSHPRPAHSTVML